MLFNSSKLAIAAAFILTLLLGYLVGRLTGVQMSISTVPLQLQVDDRPLVPVVTLFGIRNGKLEGHIEGDVRFFLGKNYILPDASGSIVTEAGPLLINEVTINIPEGALFVSSKRGTKYYSVDSAGGANIKPDNRVYFESAEAAKDAGYTP